MSDLKYITKYYVPMKTLTGFPLEVIDKILHNMHLEGVPFPKVYNIESFVQNAFVWKKSVEGYDFWHEVIDNKNFDLFFKKYPKKEIGFIVGDWYKCNCDHNLYQYAGHTEECFYHSAVINTSSKGHIGYKPGYTEIYEASLLEYFNPSNKADISVVNRYIPIATPTKPFPDKWVVEGDQHRSGEISYINEDHWYRKILSDFYQTHTIVSFRFLTRCFYSPCKTKSLSSIPEDFTLVTKEELISHFYNNPIKLNQNELSKKITKQGTTRCTGIRVSRRSIKAASSSRPTGCQATNQRRRKKAQSTKISGRILQFD